ncbi:unnamed protein product [Callosobruchus maculatus]|uniref:Uncharacterized protein n=1 Tax=Callosobruchus maculatus TaxID=64391 RepID=A0A653DRD0_CALMS|nr:unnamed protein product [Callosobruchus maculatus]
MGFLLLKPQRICVSKAAQVENCPCVGGSLRCPGFPLEEIRQRADQAVGSAQAFRDTASSASPTTRSIEAEVKDSFERIKQDLGAFNLKRYIPKPKDQQEEERKAQFGVQFAEKPPSDGFEVLHDKASALKKGTSKSDWGNITPCPSLSSRSQSQTQWQQQRSQKPASQQSAPTPNVSYVQCNRKSQSKIPQGVSPQRSEPQRPTFNQQQSAPVETLYQTGQQATPREAFNTAFIGQLPTDSQWSPTRKKTPCNHCLLHGSSTPRDAFNQGFLGQLPTDEQWASKRQQGPSATPREAFNTGSATNRCSMEATDARSPIAKGRFQRSFHWPASN